MRKLIDYNLCCNCGACQAVCPVNCITFAEENFNSYPIIDDAKCLNCKKCEKVCPVLNADTLKNKEQNICFSYQTNSKQDLQKASSGGAFFDIAKIYDNGNTVFVGAENIGLEVKHTLAYNIEDAKKFRKSKYVKSSTIGIFDKVKAELEKGKQVLFSGTPCQNASMKSYLKNKYDNILYVDIVCHGTPNINILKKYLSENFDLNKLKGFEFRNKEKYNNIYVTKILLENKNVYLLTQENDYLKLFLKGYFYQEGCYNCQFASLNRVGDITIGDFWGVETLDKSLDSSKGVSLIIANTPKGQAIVDKMESAYKKQFDIKDAITFNNNLVASTNKPDKNDILINQLLNKKFTQVAKDVLPRKNKIKILLRKYIPVKLLDILKRI